MEINIDLPQKQTDAWDYIEGYDDVLEIGYGGGARGGKSWLGCELLTYLAITNADTTYCIGRRELKRLKNTTLRTLFKVFKKNGMEKDKDYVYNQQESYIEFFNSSRILLLDLAYMPSDPLYDRFGSLELTAGWVDESQEVDELAVEILNTRVGNWNNDMYGIKPFVLETFNPSKSHVYKRYWKPYKENTMPVHRVFIQSLATDNPYIEPRYIEKLEKAREATKQRLLYGNFDYDEDERTLMNYSNIVNIFSNTHVEKGDVYISFDVAGKGKDKTVILVWFGDVVVDIYVESITDQNKLYEKIMQIKEHYKCPMSNIVGDYTGIGAGVIDRLKCVAFQGASSAIDTGSEAKETLIYANLRAQCYDCLAKLVDENSIYIISKNNDDAISEELSCIKWVNLDEFKKKIIPKDDPNGKGKENIRAILGRSPDFADALSMKMIFNLKPKKTRGFVSTR